jgi:hypothetical protein
LLATGGFKVAMTGELGFSYSWNRTSNPTLLFENAFRCMV